MEIKQFKKYTLNELWLNKQSAFNYFKTNGN